MAKVSSAPEDAYKPKSGFQEGWGKIIDAKSLVFQYPPSKEARGDRPAGHQDPPSLVLQLTIQRYLDGAGTKAPVEPEEKLLTIAYPGRDTGTLDTVHPGNYPDGDVSQEPVDAGGELGCEGNTIYAMTDGFALNSTYGYMTFTQSLVDKAFRPAVLKNSYFPDLIGLYAKFETVTLKKKSDKQTSDPTAFVVTEIKEFPYEKKAGPATPQKKAAGVAAAAGTQKKAAGAAAATVPAAAAAAPATAAAEEQSDDPEAIASSILMETYYPTKHGATLTDVKKLKMEAFMSINKHKPPVPPALKKAVTEQLGDEDWLLGFGSAMGLFERGEDGKSIIFTTP
jgi:hypothetical protein